MRLDVQIEGLDEVRRQLQGFSDRRFAAAVATGLTRSAGMVATDWRIQIAGKLDRPTPLTQRSVVVKRAEAASLAAEVLVRDQARPGAVTPAEYLGVQELGGSRGLRKFERALIAQGSMPAGHKVVPGEYAKLDSFGNVSRGQIVQVIAQLGAQYSPGYQRVISKSAAKRAQSAIRRGRNYVALLARDDKGRAPGVYEIGKYGLLPVFFYVRSVAYQRRLDLLGQAGSRAPVEAQRQIDRAIGEHIARLAGGGR